MALTQEQEDYLIDFIENGIPEEDLGNVNEAASAGTLATDTNFFVQQSNAGENGQVIPLSVMTKTDAITGQGADQVNLLMTPKAFEESVGNTVNRGTFKLGTAAKIEAGIDAESVIVPSLVPDMYDYYIKPVKYIADSDIDSSSEGTVTMYEASSIEAKGGVIEWIQLNLLFEPDSPDAKTKSIYINNVNLPASTSFGSGWIVQNSDSKSFPINCNFSDSSGMLKVEMLIHDNGAGALWDNTDTYTVKLHGHYNI